MDRANKITIGPLNRGEGQIYGYTLRQSLFRVTKGWAIVAIKIKGLKHMFESVPRVHESVQHIIRNLKHVVIKSSDKRDFDIVLKASEPCIVTAKSFELPSEAEIINPDQIICTITAQTNFELHCLVRLGQGFIQEEDIDKPSDMWAIGANFCPVVRVMHDVQEIVSGRAIDLEELTLNIETNGSVTPRQALEQACTRMCSIFGKLQVNQVQDEHTMPFNALYDPILDESIDALRLTVKIRAKLIEHNIHKLGDLVTSTKEHLRNIPGLGDKALLKIKLALQEYSSNLELESFVNGWRQNTDESDVSNGISEQDA